MSRKTITINTDDYTYLSLNDIYKNLGLDQTPWSSGDSGNLMSGWWNKYWGDKLFFHTSKVKETESLIKKVIFNAPATIILWKDGTKTVVKCGENEEYDPEKGLAMALVKHFLGNKGNYNNLFRKYLPEKTFTPDDEVLVRAKIVRPLDTKKGNKYVISLPGHAASFMIDGEYLVEANSIG